MKDIILFLGNPGTGKSTLVNCHAGKVLFKAGTSFGSGMTAMLHEKEGEGVTYMDTPGLADEKLEKAAAAAITTALQKTGSYRIFFMVRLNEGRVVQEDIQTIQRVMTSIHVGVDESLSFAVIVNKVDEEDYDELVEGQPGFNAESRTLVLASINAGKFTTTSIFFLKKMRALARKSNATTTLPQDFLNFVKNAPKIVIEDKKQITAVTTDEEDKRKLREEIAAMCKGMTDMTEATKRMAEVNEAAEAARRIEREQEAARRKEREQEARETAKLMARLHDMQEAASKTNAIAESKRLKRAYGNGISFEFVISNKSKTHPLTKKSVNISSGKDTSDAYVKFPSSVAPMSSEAGFHAKRDGAAVGSEGTMTYDINGAWFYIKWSNPYIGAFSAKVTVQSNKGFDVESETRDGFLHAIVKDAP